MIWGSTNGWSGANLEKKRLWWEIGKSSWSESFYGIAKLMKGTKFISWRIPSWKNREIPRIGLGLSFNAWIWMISLRAYYIYSLDQPSYLFDNLTKLSEVRENFFHLSLVGSIWEEIKEWICWLFWVMINSEGRGTKGSSGSASGFLMGENLST